ncbi:MAG: pH regulation protein F [Phycisphaerales bacterium]|nr:MAG: pH regulation protein F [Phycisphaerales bacterium]
MELFYLVAATLLLINVMVGFIRIVRGPTAADRMLSAQLFGTSGVAILLLLAQGMQVDAFRDVALVLAILAVVAVVAFVRRVWRPLAAE